MIHSQGTMPDPWVRKTKTDELIRLIDQGFSVKEVAERYDLTVKKVAHAYTDHDRLRKPKKVDEKKVDHTVISEVVFERQRYVARCYHCIWQSNYWGTKPDAEEALTLHYLREHP